MTPEKSDFRMKRTAALISLGVGIAMLVGKWGAFVLTGSSAILSDALESIVHVVATGFAFLSILLVARPPDPKFPYGYGKIAYFSAGFEGGLIALASVAIVFEAVKGLIFPRDLNHLGTGLGLIAVASVVNLFLGLWLIRKGKASDSLILEADGHHVLADSYTSFGVVAGVALVWITGRRWLDPVLAIIVGLNILRTGYHLVSEAVLGLMDRADPELLEKIVNALQNGRMEGWMDVHQLRAWKAGDRTFVDFHLAVPPDWTVLRLHEAHDHARAILRETLGESTETIIHFDPHSPSAYPDVDAQPWSLQRAVRIARRDRRKVADESNSGESHPASKVPVQSPVQANS